MLLLRSKPQDGVLPPHSTSVGGWMVGGFLGGWMGGNPGIARWVDGGGACLGGFGIPYSILATILHNT